MTSKQAREAWIQLGRDLRREQYVPLDSVNNPSIKMLDAYKQALRQVIEKEIQRQYREKGVKADEDGSVGFCLWFIDKMDTVTPTKE